MVPEDQIYANTGGVLPPLPPPPPPAVPYCDLTNTGYPSPYENSREQGLDFSGSDHYYSVPPKEDGEAATRRARMKHLLIIVVTLAASVIIALVLGIPQGSNDNFEDYESSHPGADVGVDSGLTSFAPRKDDRRNKVPDFSPDFVASLWDLRNLRLPIRSEELPTITTNPKDETRLDNIIDEDESVPTLQLSSVSPLLQQYGNGGCTTA